MHASFSTVLSSLLKLVSAENPPLYLTADWTGPCHVTRKLEAWPSNTRSQRRVSYGREEAKRAMVLFFHPVIELLQGAKWVIKKSCTQRQHKKFIQTSGDHTSREPQWAWKKTSCRESPVSCTTCCRWRGSGGVTWECVLGCQFECDRAINKTFISSVHKSSLQPFCSHAPTLKLLVLFYLFFEKFQKEEIANVHDFVYI